MKVNPLITVIIPIYNKGPYIKECLDSVLSQSYKNIEVICIDDGSSDNSISIVEDVIKKDKRVTLYKTKHSGPSKARNIGIKYSRGDYIHFVDADDLIKPNTYHTITNQINKYKNIDLVMFYFHDFIDNVLELKKINISSDYRTIFETEDCKYFKLIENPFYAIEICGNGANLANKLFNSKVIKKYKLLFDNKLLFYEDSDFYYKFAVHSSNILAMPYDFYCYRHNVEGQQSKTKENETNIYRLIFKVYYNSLDNYKKLNDECLCCYIKSLLHIIFESYKAINKFDARCAANKELLYFIETNKNESYFSKNLSSFSNDLELVKFNNLSLISNINIKIMYERELAEVKAITNSKTYKIDKIIMFPYMLLKRFISKIIKR